MRALPFLTRRELVVKASAGAAGVAAAGVLAGTVRAASGVPRAHDVEAEVATAWFDLALQLIRTTPGFTPPVAARALGYAGLTLYEAVVPGMKDFRSLAGTLEGLAPLLPNGRSRAYDWHAAANAALASIIRGLFPGARAEQLTTVDALEQRLAPRPWFPSITADRSVRWGQAVAAAIFDWSRGDGGHQGYLRNFPPYSPPVGRGLWVPTPPGFLSALQPAWGANRCLALPNGAACPPGNHPPFSEEPGSAFHAEAIEVFETVDRLTPEQGAIARFWSDDPGTTPTPPGHSISIATQVLRHEGASLATAAETYARVCMAVSDAFVACWYQKYVYNLFRPVTYLRRLVDPSWLPILVTPPFPEYPSGHSVQSGAAFQVLTDLFGDAYGFVDRTHEDRGLVPRRFDSFLAAAEEAAISRLYGGIHFRAAVDNGVAQGRCIGREVSALPLRA